MRTVKERVKDENGVAVLPLEFTAKNLNFKQVKRQNDVAIYLKTNPKTNFRAWEVFRVKRHNGYILGGNKIEPAENYPGDSQFGLIAWECDSEERALKRFNELLIENQNKSNKKEK